MSIERHHANQLERTPAEWHGLGSEPQHGARDKRRRVGETRRVKGPVDPERTLPVASPDLDRTLPAPGPAGAAPNPFDDAVTTEPATKKHAPTGEAPLTTFQELKLIAKDFLKRNEKVMWWLHTVYALSLGAFVATFAAKGFEQARMLTLSLTLAWLLVVFFFRFFGTGAQQDFMTAWPGARRRFFIMSYLMKNLFQGMLFYLLPFYWKSSSYDAKTFTIFGFLAACAVLSTLDLVFDRMLLRFKLVASLFFAITLFGCANLVIPALLPDTAVIVTFLVSSGLSIATFLLFHLSLDTLKKPLVAAVFVSLIGLGVGVAYSARQAMPPVPLELREGGVGPAILDDGKLLYEIRSLRAAQAHDLFAVTDVRIVGRAERFKHVWKRNQKELRHEPAEAAPATERGVVRVASKLPRTTLPEDAVGLYSVDVVTESGQIVGRVLFEIKP